MRLPVIPRAGPGEPPPPSAPPRPEPSAIYDTAFVLPGAEGRCACGVAGALVAGRCAYCRAGLPPFGRPAGDESPVAPAARPHRASYADHRLQFPEAYAD